MIKTSLCCLFLLGASPLIAQNVPNGGFEIWETRTLYEEPENWTTGNMLSFLFGQTVASKTTDSYTGQYALRLDTRVTDETIPGYAFSNGMITEGNLDTGFQFKGGIPISGTPTQLSGYYKYSIAFPDAGVIMVAFKKNGITIGQQFHPLIFSSSGYTKIDIPIDAMPEVPDTAFIAFATTNPDNPKKGGWILVDSLWFSGIQDTIPNYSFENWMTEEYYDAAEWLTPNLFVHLFGGDTSATRTTDAYSGNFALRLENIQAMIPDDDGLANAHLGFVMPYAQNLLVTDSLPTFAVDFNPVSLTGYYKFFPFDTDTALIIVSLTNPEGAKYEFSTILPPVDEYTAFDLSFDYPFGTSITHTSIVANTTLSFDPSSHIQSTGEVGSVLFLDELDLTNDCFYLETFGIEVLQQATCDNDTAILDAGAGWGSYSWTTGDTTRIISLEVTDRLTVGVIVTATDSWCFYEDEIDLIPAENCPDALSPSQGSDQIRLFPNPGTGLFVLETHDPRLKIDALKLISTSGQVVFQMTEPGRVPNNRIQLDFTDLSQGLYYLKITAQESTRFYPVLIQ